MNRYMVRRPSPDCAVGKHGACSGDGWDDELDMLTVCPCPCHFSAAVPNEPVLINVHEAAAFAHTTPDVIRQWAARGKITRYGTRSRRLYDARELAQHRSGEQHDTPTRPAQGLCLTHLSH